MVSTHNCIIGQSGGPTVAINASLSGVLQEILATKTYQTVYGMVNGIEGLLAGKYLNLSETFSTQEACDKLATTPAMYLGSCRFKLPHHTDAPDTYARLFDFLMAHNIKTFFYIGGNDSMDTVVKLSHYAKAHDLAINIIGIPKTVDNDLPITDHTPGFGSAAKFVATTLLEIAHDTYIYNVPSITIVEIMGRNAGWLTAASALARRDYSPAPDLIYLPEVAFDMADFTQSVIALQKTRQNIVIAVSEGIKDKDGNYISATSGTVDAFGHKQLCGAGKTLENHLKATLGCKVRSVELNVLQRAAAHIASKTDIDESIAIGKEAARLGAAGKTAEMVCYKRVGNAPYVCEVISYAIEAIANKEQTIPREWINEAGNDVCAPLLDYLRPLIQGETLVGYEDGVPAYMPVTHLVHPNFFK